MVVFIPGRHHVLTRFQEKVLKGLCEGGAKADAVIFAVTSANHQNTRRNPLPFHLRAMAIQDFANSLSVPVYVYGINDVGIIEDFASFTLKSIRHQSGAFAPPVRAWTSASCLQSGAFAPPVRAWTSASCLQSDGRFDLVPDDTIVVCSTPVLEGYEKLGFKINTAELAERGYKKYNDALPWEVVERIASLGGGWTSDPWVLEKIHPASFKIWKNYGLGERAAMLFRDGLLGQDGDLTETRDYNTYVRQMDDIAQLKYDETRPYIRPGRIGDIGCAVGSWIRLACADPRFRESDFYGIEAARQLFSVCQQRKENGEFANPNVFFAQKNAVAGPCFENSSMDTIHTSSLTHEIESYGSREDLLRFIANRMKELAHGGVWINRDVVGPPDGGRVVLLWLDASDGKNEGFDRLAGDRAADGRAGLQALLDGLSTRERFRRFARDFRRGDGKALEGSIQFESVKIGGEEYFRLTLAGACEYLYKKDYTDNWLSEMHERFCFWDLEDWKKALGSEGYTIHPASRAFRNDWIVKNRLEKKARIYIQSNNVLEALDFPVTHMVMVAVREI